MSTNFVYSMIFFKKNTFDCSNNVIGSRQRALPCPGATDGATLCQRGTEVARKPRDALKIGYPRHNSPSAVPLGATHNRLWALRVRILHVTRVEEFASWGTVESVIFGIDVEGELKLLLGLQIVPYEEKNWLARSVTTIDAVQLIH